MRFSAKCPSEAAMMRKSDPADPFMEQYSRRRPHVYLGGDGENGTLTHAFMRNVPPRGETAVDRQAGRQADRQIGRQIGEECHVK